MKNRRSLMSVTLLFILALILAILPLIVACSKATPDSTQAISGSDKPVELKFAYRAAATGWGPVHAINPWIKQVEEVTKSRVKIVLYPNQTLVKAPEWEAVKSGIADMAWIVNTDLTGTFPLTEVLGIPGSVQSSSAQNGVVMWQLYEKYPSIKKEYAAVQPLVFHGGAPWIIASTKKQIKTVEDLKGLKIRAIGGLTQKAIEAIGAVPVNINATELYESAQKGIIDGMLINTTMIITYKLYEVCKYFSFGAPVTSGVDMVFMNLNKWDSLPSDVQKQMLSLGGLEGAKWWSYQWFDSSAPACVDEVKKAGYEMIQYTLASEETAKWSKLCKPIQDQWIKDMEAKGYSETRDVLDTSLKLANDFNKK